MSPRGTHTEDFGMSGVLQTFQHDVDDVRGLMNCGICARPLYEPFTIACGHTFCYSCLTQWFINHRQRKTCPDCRTLVEAEPAPAYLLRNIVNIFISRQELLEDGETSAEHLALKRAETEKLESDKANRDPATGGLFGGCFKTAKPFHDSTDGVDRCPLCGWELEDGECGNCEFTLDMVNSPNLDSDGQDSIIMTDREEGTDDGSMSEWPVTPRRSETLTAGHFLTGEYWDYDDYDSEMDSFIDDDIDNNRSDGTEQGIVNGDGDMTWELSPSVGSGRGMSSPNGDTGRMNATSGVVELLSSDDEDEDEDKDDNEDEDEDDDDDDDEPIRAPGRASRPGWQTTTQRPSGFRLESRPQRRPRPQPSGSTARDAISVDDNNRRRSTHRRGAARPSQRQPRNRRGWQTTVHVS